MNARLYLTSGLGLAAVVAALVAPQLFPRLARAEVVEATPAVQQIWPDETVDLESVATVDPVEAPIEARVEAPIEARVEAKAVSRDVDIVICLDTSGSMGNLIDSVRAKLWDIVNEVSELEPDAHLRVGLISYGSPGPAGPDRGFVVRQIDLTDDLDSVYAKVMSLSIDGGSEYVGWALSEAVQHMSWSDQDNAAKIIFIAGNEGADQGRQFRDYRDAVSNAGERGILINTIYAGNRQAGVNEGWRTVAEIGGGKYSHIDMARGTVQTVSPQDAKLRELNAALNGSYVPYGANGSAGLANQKAQDANAYGLGMGSGSSRAVSKMSRQYVNPMWDLVDALTAGTVKLADLSPSDLPAELRGKSVTAQRVWLDDKREQRQAIKEEIRHLSIQRKAHLDAEAAHDGDDALDEAVRSTLEAQL